MVSVLSDPGRGGIAAARLVSALAVARKHPSDPLTTAYSTRFLLTTLHRQATSFALSGGGPAGAASPPARLRGSRALPSCFGLEV